MIRAYSILGISRESTLTECRKAYSKLIRQHHPDRRGGDANRAAELNLANMELGTADDKRKYDMRVEVTGKTCPACNRRGRTGFGLRAVLCSECGGEGTLAEPDNVKAASTGAGVAA